jgi:hypothetical protein
MNNLSSNKKIFILSLIVILLSVFSIWLIYLNTLSWNIVQSQNGEVDVYLKGTSAPKVIAAELDISLDTNRVKISSVTAGGFFVSPLIVKFDDKKLAYSLMINPGNNVGNDLSKPLFKFYLSPGILTGYNFSILPGSQVYLLDIGGAYPRQSQIILK